MYVTQQSFGWWVSFQIVSMRRAAGFAPIVCNNFLQNHTRFINFSSSEFLLQFGGASEKTNVANGRSWIGFGPPAPWCDGPNLAARCLSQPAQRGPLSRRGKSNEFASQIRRVQIIRFRVIWRVTEFVGKSLIFEDAQSNEFRSPAM